MTLTSSAPVVAIGTLAIVQLLVEVNGSPLVGANVSLTATSGSMSAANGVTDSSGQFTDTFVPSTNGVATITAVVQDPVIGNQTTGTNILVTLPGAAGTGTAPAKGLGLLGSILPIVVVLVVVAIIALGARRMLKRRTSADDGEEKDSDSE